VNTFKTFFLPVSILSGAIIGAGVFALPFVFQRSGFVIGVVYLGISALVYSYLYILYSDVILRTKKEHRFVGYAHTYLGAPAAWAATGIAVLGIIFAMAIFLVLSVSFFNIFISFLDNLTKAFLFWGIGSIATFSSLKKIVELEFIITLGIVIIIIVVFGLGISQLQFGTISFESNLRYFLIPLGPIFFALAGRTAIPVLIHYFRSIKKEHDYTLIKKTIITGTFLPIVVYILFILGVIGLSPSVTPDAITGLLGSAPYPILVLVGVLGLLSLWSTYILLGLNVSNILQYDFSFSFIPRVLVVGVLPFVLYFFTSESFIGLVSFTGGIFLALEGFFIMAMWRSANKLCSGKSKLISKGHALLASLSILVLSSAFIYEIVRQFL
jgi:amino acid permease